MRIFSVKTYILFILILLISAPSYAEKSGKPLVEKLQEGQIIINSSVRGCDEECKLGILEAAISVRMGAAALRYSIVACEADADKHCLDVQPGEGRIVSCIRANESNVSKECVTALKQTGLWELGN